MAPHPTTPRPRRQPKPATATQLLRLDGMLSEALDLGVAIAGTLGGAEQIIQTRLAGEVDARVATTPAVSLVQAAARRLAEAGPDTLGEALSELHGALEGLEALDRPR